MLGRPMFREQLRLTWSREVPELCPTVMLMGILVALPFPSRVKMSSLKTTCYLHQWMSQIWAIEVKNIIIIRAAKSQMVQGTSPIRALIRRESLSLGKNKTFPIRHWLLSNVFVPWSLWTADNARSWDHCCFLGFGHQKAGMFPQVGGNVLAEHLCDDTRGSSV